MSIDEQKALILQELKTIVVPRRNTEKERLCQQFRKEHYTALPASEHGWLNITVSDYFGV